MRVAVTTPTGNVGSRVVRLLVQAGVRPALLLRDPDKLDEGLRPHVDLFPGDLGDAEYVRRATEGADALYWVDPTNLFADDPNAETERLGRIAADAVRANDIGKVVFQSSVGAELRHGAGLIDGLAAVEEVLGATGTDLLVLRCGYFFSNLLMDAPSLAQGVLSTTTPASIPWVDPRDVGDVAAAALLVPGAGSGTRVQAVHGPEDLTFEQVAEIVSAATGRTVKVQLIPDEEQRAGLLAAGLPPAAADGMVGMLAGTRDGFVPEQPRDVLSTTPTSLAAWASAVLRPVLDAA